ncbi:tape measure protein [Motilimonas cestriensis]|uniref:tape measure protein n=1 Tax=Motilimonas cestriensis TaxID=2742685 RepID=UPI003DA52030
MSNKEATVSLLIQGEDEASPALRKTQEALEQVNKESKATTDELNALKAAERKLVAQRELEQWSEAVGASLIDAKQAVSKLNHEIGEGNKPTRDQADALKLVNQSAKAAQREYDKVTQALDKNRAALNLVGINTRDLDGEQKRLAQSSANLVEKQKMLRGESQRLGKEMKWSADSAERLKGKNKELSHSLDDANTSGAGFSTGLNQITLGLIAAGAAYIGIDTLKNSVLDLLNTGGRFEKLDTQMKSLMGSIEAGERATQWVQDFAKNTPYQLDGVTAAFVKMKAFGLDPMDGSMQAIADQVAKLGGDQEMLEGTVLAVGQAWAKQKLQGEEILQLIERGIPVWDLLEKATGKNTLELQKMSSAGQLGRKEIKLLMDEMAKGAAGSAIAMMDTWNGLASNLQDNIDKLKNTVAKAGLLDYFKAELSQLNGLIDEMAADGRLKEYAAQVSNAITGTIDALKIGVTTIYEWRTEIGALLALVAGFKMASMFGGFASAASDAIGALIRYRTQLNTTAASATTLKTVSAGLFGPMAIAATLAAPAIAWATKELIGYEEAVLAAKGAEELKQSTTKALNETLKTYSEQVGIQIKDAEHLATLERTGVVAFDEKAKAYYNVATAAKEKPPPSKRRLRPAIL